jgi:hypothetical protein
MGLNILIPLNFKHAVQAFYLSVYAGFLANIYIMGVEVS